MEYYRGFNTPVRKSVNLIASWCIEDTEPDGISYDGNMRMRIRQGLKERGYDLLKSGAVCFKADDEARIVEDVREILERWSSLFAKQGMFLGPKDVSKAG